MLRAFFVVVLLACAMPAYSASKQPDLARPVLVLGDSLSAAYRLSPDEGWVALLEKRLHQAASPHPVVNASISGETSAGGLARLPPLLARHHPLVVVVELGANDGLRGLALTQVRNNLARILTAIQAADSRAVLVGIELPPNYGPRYRDGLRDMYRGLADEFNVPLLPFLLDGVALDPALMQDDGLHPKAAGEPRVLANVWPLIEASLAATQSTK